MHSIFPYLSNFALISGERGPGFGDTPAPPPEFLSWPGSVPYGSAYGARSGLMWCLSTLDVPVAGGELAHRGACPTLLLYLSKRNTPQIKVSPQERGVFAGTSVLTCFGIFAQNVRD